MSHETPLRGGGLVRLCHYSPREHLPPHLHDRSTIALVVRGSLEERAAGAMQQASALSVVVKPAGTLHEDRFGPDGADLLQIVLPPRAPTAVPGAGGRLRGWRWVHAGDAARPMLEMLGLLSARPTGCAPLGDPLARLLAQALLALQPETGAAADRAPEWLRAARASLAEPSSTVREAAGAAGVHPVHLARAFRAHFGATPSEYRRRSRLHRAAALLTDTLLPISEIAYACGFADQAHLTRAIRRWTGGTPGHLRRLLGAA